MPTDTQDTGWEVVSSKPLAAEPKAEDLSGWDVVESKPLSSIRGMEQLGAPPVPKLTPTWVKPNPQDSRQSGYMGIPTPTVAAPEPIMPPQRALPITPRPAPVRSGQPQDRNPIIQTEERAVTPEPLGPIAVEPGKPVSITGLAQPKPGKDDVGAAVNDLRTLLLGPAYGVELKKDSGVEGLVNGFLRASAGFSTPEGIATMVVGAGLASKLPELLESAKFTQAMAQHPVLAKGLELAAKRGVSATVAATSLPTGLYDIEEGIRTGDTERLGKGIASAAIGGMAAWHALDGLFTGRGMRTVGTPEGTEPGADQTLVEKLKNVIDRVADPSASEGKRIATNQERRVAQLVLKKRFGVEYGGEIKPDVAAEAPETATKPTETAPKASPRESAGPVEAPETPSATIQNQPAPITVEEGNSYSTAKGKASVTSVIQRPSGGPVINYDLTLPDGTVQNLRLPQRLFLQELTKQPTPTTPIAATPTPVAEQEPGQAPPSTSIVPPEAVQPEPTQVTPVQEPALEQSEIPPANSREEVVPPQPVEPEQVGGTPQSSPESMVSPVSTEPTASESPKVATGETQKHEYGSTQANLPAKESDIIRDFSKSIAKEDLTPDGLEDQHHVTVRYGNDEADEKRIAKALEGQGPITVKVKGLSLFPNVDTEHGKADVLKLDVDSPELRRLNRKVGEAVPHPGETFPDYKPHVTVAYLKAGTGKKYVAKGIPGLSGKTITLDSVAFSGKDDKQVDIPLSSKSVENQAVASAKPLTRKDRRALEVKRREGIYTPGNVIAGYGGQHDKVLDYKKGSDSLGGQDQSFWKVQVQHVDSEGNLIDRPRWHSTEPDRNTKVVSRAEPELEPVDVEGSRNSRRVSILKTSDPAVMAQLAKTGRASFFINPTGTKVYHSNQEEHPSQEHPGLAIEMGREHPGQLSAEGYLRGFFGTSKEGPYVALSLRNLPGSINAAQRFLEKSVPFVPHEVVMDIYDVDGTKRLGGGHFDSVERAVAELGKIARKGGLEPVDIEGAKPKADIEGHRAIAEHEFDRAVEGRRGERETSDRTIIQKGERDVIATASEGVPQPDRRAFAKDVEQRIRKTKESFPTTGEFAFQPLTVRKVTPEVKKNGSIVPKIEYKNIPYSYDAPIRGKRLWKTTSLTPEGGEVATKMADAIFKEVSEIRKRAQAAKKEIAKGKTPDSSAITAVKIESQRDWYNRMRSILRKEFGSAGDLFADLLGATSAQTPVATNWKQAVEALERVTKGHYDEIIPPYKEFRKAGGRATKYTGERALRYGDANYNANTLAVMDVLSGLWRGKAGAPKTQNYAGNLIGTGDESTIDVWAARMLQRIRNQVFGDAPAIPQPAEIGVQGEVAPSGETTGQFMFGQKVFAKAAKRLGMKPHELQAFLWFAEKDLWTRKGLTSAVGEGGDMASSARAEGLGRITAGIEPKDSGAPGNAVSMMKPVVDIAKAMPSVKAIVNTPARGMWSAPGGDAADAVVWSSNFEVTFKRDDPGAVDKIAAEVFKAAKANSQDDAFVARTVESDDRSAANVRPALSVYFRKPLGETEAWKIIDEVKTDQIGGFTLFSGPELGPGEFRGMRFVYMPEYVHAPEDLIPMGVSEIDTLVEQGRQDAFTDMDKIVQKLEGDERIGHALVEQLEVLNGTRENYDDLIAELGKPAKGAADRAPVEGAATSVAPGAGPWGQPIGASVRARAIARVRAGSGEATGADGQALEPVDAEAYAPPKIPKLDSPDRADPYVSKAPTSFHIANAEIKPIPLDGSAAGIANAFVASPSAMELVGRAAGRGADQTGPSFAGMHLAPKDAGTLARNLKLVTKGQLGRATPLHMALEDASKAGKSIILVSDHPAFALFQDDALTEEVGHAYQAQLAGKTKQHMGGALGRFTSNPIYQRAAADLRGRYGDVEPGSGQEASEVGVRLMRPGGHQEMGLSVGEARSLATEYVKALRSEYGSRKPKQIAQEVFSAFQKAGRGVAGESDALPDRAGQGRGEGVTGRDQPDLSGSRTEEGIADERKPRAGGEQADGDETVPPDVEGYSPSQKLPEHEWADLAKHAEEAKPEALRSGFPAYEKALQSAVKDGLLESDDVEFAKELAEGSDKNPAALRTILTSLFRDAQSKTSPPDPEKPLTTAQRLQKKLMQVFKGGSQPAPTIPDQAKPDWVRQVEEEVARKQPETATDASPKKTPKPSTEEFPHEVKESKLAQGVEKKAIANKLTTGFEGRPEYRTVNVKEQADLAEKLIKSDIDKAIDVAMGNAIPPGDLLPESVFVAVENYATEKGDVELLQKLATSSALSLEATGMGQRIRMLGERNPDSPVAAMQQVTEARQAVAKRRYGPKASEKLKAKAKEAIKTANKQKAPWINFIKEITCK